MSEIERLKFGADRLDQLLMEGLTVDQVPADEGAYERLLKLGKPTITPFLSPLHNDFTEANAFYFFLQKDGVDAAGVGCRYFDLGTEPFHKFLERLFRRHHPQPEGGPTIISGFTEQLTEVSGRLVYQGDLFFNPKHRGNRNNLEIFIELFQLTIRMKWDFDWIFAFMRSRDVGIGFGDRYGFLRHYPKAQTWIEEAPGRSSSEYLMLTNRYEIDWLVRSRVQ